MTEFWARFRTNDSAAPEIERHRDCRCYCRCAGDDKPAASEHLASWTFLRFLYGPLDLRDVLKALIQVLCETLLNQLANENVNKQATQKAA